MEDEYSWIEHFFKTRKPDRRLTVQSIVPAIFKRYFVIEQNYGIIDDFPFDDYPEDNQSIENLNKRHNIERRYGLFLNNNTEHLYRPITIKELALRFNTEYSIDTLCDIKQTPGVGTLYHRSAERIVQLAEHLITSACFLYIPDINRSGMNENGDFGERNRITNSETYGRFVKEIGLDYCSYLFPKGNTWCLSTYEDVDNLILSCNDETADVLTSVEDLEYFEVHHETVLRNLW